MESPILKQIVKFLQTRKKQKQWMVVFVFMAVIVGVGTVTALKMMGQAMTRKEHVLDCQLQVHQHTKDCYDGNNNLVCGYADYVVHKHNDDCYNSEGKLVCRLPEVEKHEHTKKCYEKTKTLVCGQEESAGHEHTDGCYTTQKGALDCKKEEHQHNDGCYDEEGNLVCGMEEHQHNDDCYKYEDVLTCKIKEGEGGHKHTDKCYDVQEVLTCGKLEMHKHTDKCFEKIDKNGKDEPENLKLVCKKTELLEHTHTEDAGCLRTVDAAEADVIQAELDKEAEEAALDKAAEEGREIFTTDMNEEEENGEDAEASEGEESEVAEGEDAANPEGDAAEGEDGAAADEAEPETYEETKTYEGLGYIVTASYNKDANIPEEAKFVAERITKESDEEDYKKHEEEYKKSVGNENATMSALFKIGFYVDGEEVEPATPVAITVQFVDKNGLPEGAPIKVVHFGDDKTEVIKGSKAESGSTSFKTDSFSKFAIGSEETDETDAEKASVHISDSYEYDDGTFHVTFQVEGKAKPLKDNKEKNKDEQKNEGVLPPEEEDGAVEEAAEGGTETGSESSEEATEDATETEAESEAGEETDVKDKDAADENSEKSGLEFRVNKLGEDSEEYKAVVEHVRSANDGSELLSAQTLFYSMYYDGVQLDLSDCKVTVKVEPAQSLSSDIKASVPEVISELRQEGDIAEGSENAENDSLQKELALVSYGKLPEKETPDELGAVYLGSKNAGSVLSADLTAYTNEEGGSTTITTETTENPNFTVQYYANLDIMNKTGTNALPVIDTSGKKLPKNGNGVSASPNGNSIKNIYVDNNGNIQTTKTLTEVYKFRPYEYIKAPTINYINALVENPNYKLKEIWINKHKHTDSCYDANKNLKCDYAPGKEKLNSINKNEWDTYVYSDKLHFSNREVKPEDIEPGHQYIRISKDSVIRLVYDVSTAKPDFKAAFYDYDISSGRMYTNVTNAINNSSTGITQTGSQKNETLYYAYTKEAGINSSGNYSGSGTKLAFGNVNTGTTLGENLWGGNLLNKYNGTQGGHPTVTGAYKGCTFGLVTGLEGGKIQYANGVIAPNLFNEGNATGKKNYDKDQYSLKFNRAGDTYTLTAVNGTDATGLESFGHPSPNSTTTHTHIWTNDFWPMDSAGSYGTNGHDLKFGSYAQRNNRAYAGSNTTGEPGSKTGDKKTFPYSDDGKDHNSYFGMKYEVEFELKKDYVGPLEYYFFGDDDMWVFLDNKLVCDIGGVHSSVGEYVNLWDYIKKGSEGKHTLSFYYTERGASGSTCWMQFTLPSASSLTPETSKNDFGHLKIEKEVKMINDQTKEEMAFDSNDEFEFEITLKNNADGNLKDDYRYTKFNQDGTEDDGGSGLIIWKPFQNGVISNGTKFTLKHGQYILIQYLPKGTKYTVTEKNGVVYDGEVKDGDYIYTTDITANGQEVGKDLGDTGDKTASGSIKEQQTEEIKYVNKAHAYELPETGGSGIMIYTIAGALCILLGAGFMYTKKARERRV